MFEAVNSWSLPAHLSMVSGWSARCSKHGDPMSCKSALKAPFGVKGHGKKLDYPWTDLTYLLHRDHVKWRYYVANGSQPDCADSQMFCRHLPQGASTPGIWNPLPRFDTVQHDHQLGNIQPLGDFYRAARKGTLAAVTWITPSQSVSEHPPALVTAGQTWVTRLINTIMESPDWKSTAIFLAWDDWGGFYDHVKPPRVDGEGYGHTGARARHQPVCETGLRRPPGPQLRRLPQVHRGRLPARPATESTHRRPAGLATGRARERQDPRQHRPRLRLRPEAAAATVTPAPPAVQLRLIPRVALFLLALGVLAGCGSSRRACAVLPRTAASTRSATWS